MLSDILSLVMALFDKAGLYSILIPSEVRREANSFYK